MPIALFLRYTDVVSNNVKERMVCTGRNYMKSVQLDTHESVWYDVPINIDFTPYRMCAGIA